MTIKFNMIGSLAIAAAVLTACAPTLVDGTRDGGIVETRSQLGVGFVGFEVTSFAKRAQALSLERADRHCARFDKRARIVEKGANAFRFECIGNGGKGT